MGYHKQNLVAFVVCPVLTLFLWLTPLYAATSLPLHRISVSFDLSRHRIHGTVDITTPKNIRAILAGKGLRITKFTVNGDVIDPEVKDGRINLPAHPDRSHVLLEYEGVFTGKELKIDENTIGAEGAFLVARWYPTAETELALFSLTARIPQGFRAISEAETVSVREVGRERLVTFDFPHPVSSINFVMASYVVKTDKYRDVEVATYLLPEDQSFADQYLAYTKKYLKMYEEMLGPYPFRRFAVVENTLPTGYGMPTFTLLGRQVLKLPFIPETSLGHEVLHSWFGNSVYVDYESGNWSEGLTAYLADHYYEQLKGKGWQYRKKTIENYESYVHEDNEIPVRYFSGGEDRALRAVGYGKTAMLFHMLRNSVGDEPFRKGLKRLAREQRFQLTSWQDLERIFSKTSGKDLSDFFEFWVEKKGAIEVGLKKIRLYRTGRNHNLEFTIRMTNSPKVVSLPIVIHAEHHKERRVLLVSDAEQTFTFSLEDKPLEIIMDPDYDLFRSLGPAESRPVLSRLLGDPTRTVVAPETNRKIYESLIQELQNRGFKTASAKEVSHADLGKKTFLFLGPQSEFKSFFPEVPETAAGFSLQIKQNPFKSKLVLGLALARDPSEVSDAVPKLFHYGQYSSLKFSEGKNLEKKTVASDRGIRVEVPPPVTGIALDTVLPLTEIISQIADKTIVYVGEKHDRYGDHLMQLEVIQALNHRHSKLAIGMEMFQLRYQKALDNYVSGVTDEPTFLRESRYFSTWRFNFKLYQDILQYARAHRIPVLALNQDHQLVGKVADQGLERLDLEEKEILPREMAFDDEAYEKRLRRVFEMHQVELPGDSAPQVFEYFHQAQILWDETMAESIATFLADRPDCHLVVLAGNGHLAYGSGIPKRAYRRTAKDYAIVLPNPEEPLEPGLADFVVFPSEVETPEAAKLGVMLATAEGELKVTGFALGSGAKEAGIEEGDVILTVDDQKVEDIDDLKAFLAARNIGDKVRIKVRREEAAVELDVELMPLMPHGR